jgi:hypothetical protein
MAALPVLSSFVAASSGLFFVSVLSVMPFWKPKGKSADKVKHKIQSQVGPSGEAAQASSSAVNVSATSFLTA